MAIADELIALLGFELTGEGAAKRYEQTLGRLTTRVGEFAKTAGIMAGAAGAAMVTGFGLLGRSVLNTSAQFESYQATLETIEGSAEKARQSLDWIADFAKATPYDVAQITESFVKLKAYGIDPIANDTLRILGDTGSAMGKTLDQAVEAFADASTGEFERLKEFGIKAKTEGDNVTFSWTKNGEELTQTVKKSATEIRAFLLETMGDRFTGAMDRQSRTWNGMVSNLGDTWSGFQRKIGEAGFFANISGKLEQLLATIDRLDAEGRLDEWATALSNSLSWTADVLWAIGTRFAENAAFLAENWDSLQGPVMAVAAAFGLLVARVFPLWTAFVLAGLALDDILAYMQGGESVLGNFIQWLQDTIGVSEDVAEALTGLGGAVAAALGLAFLIAPIRTLRLFGTLLSAGILAALAKARMAMFAAVIAWGPGLTAALAGLKAAVSAGITAALFLLTNPIGWAILLAGAAAGLIWYFWDDLVAAWNDLSARAKAMFEEMKQWFLDIDWAGVGSAIMTAIWDGMKAIGENIKSWFLGLFTLPDIFGEGPGAQPAVPQVYSQPNAYPGGVNPDWAPVPLTEDALDYKLQLQQEEWNRVMGNLEGNLQRMVPDQAVDATITDARQDNRQFPLTNNVTVNQTVQQPVNAPSQAAQAVGNAVQQSVANQRTQIEQEPAF